MGVYIHGMEMPTSCHDCEIGGAKQLDKAGNCPFYRLDGREQEKYSDRRVEGCPIVPVPPHGRLGDMDALIATYERQIERHKEQAEKAAMKDTGYTKDMYIIDRNRDIISALKAAPTIIPAEEGET